MKILALDIGLHRIGVAIADNSIIAGYDTIVYHNRRDALQKIFDLIRLEGIERIVVGLVTESESQSADMARNFAMEINKNINIPIDFVDETLTSKEAERILQNSKLDPRSGTYKEEVDKISAKLILEQYLNDKN